MEGEPEVRAAHCGNSRDTSRWVVGKSFQLLLKGDWVRQGKQWEAGQGAQPLPPPLTYARAGWGPGCLSLAPDFHTAPLQEKRSRIIFSVPDTLKKG
jgi:hypothetical protein